jgi:outer membrane lipoprotein-sorting protein
LKEFHMKKVCHLLILSAAMVVSALAQAAAQKPDAKAEALPTADQVVEKYIKASGGKDALEKCTSRVSKGTLEVPAFSVGGPLETYAKAPNKAFFKADIQGFGVVQQGYDGKTAWSQDPQSGLRELAGAELSDTKLSSEFNKTVKFKEFYPKISVKSKEKVGDHEAYLVEASPKEGASEKWYFDVQSGLPIRIDVERHGPEGAVAISQYFDNYKMVDGLNLPFSIRQERPDFAIVLKFEEIKNNVSVDDAKFAKPAAQ